MRRDGSDRRTGTASCGTSPSADSSVRLRLRSGVRRSLRGEPDRGPARRRRRRLARLRQPDRARRAEGRRDRPRPGQRRRHRRAALGPPRRTDRQGLRPRHDRRHAGARRGQPAEERPHQRRVPARRHRAHPAARRLGRRRSSRTASSTCPATRIACSPRPSASSSRAAASRSATSWCAVSCPPRCGSRWSCGSAASPARSRKTTTAPSSPRPDSPASTLEVTREYSFDDASSFLAAEGLDAQQLARDVVGRVVSAFVRASKPVQADRGGRACCGPTCCG